MIRSVSRLFGLSESCNSRKKRFSVTDEDEIDTSNRNVKKCRANKENNEEDISCKDTNAAMIASEEDDENSADDDQISLSTNDLTEQASIGTLTPLQDFFNLLTFERLQHTNTLSPSSSSSYKNHSGTTQIAIEESGLKTQQQFWNSQDIFNNHQYNNSLGAIAELPSPNPKYLDGSGTENIRKSKTADSASMWGWFVLTDDK